MARTPKAEDLSINSAIETLSSVADMELSSTVQDPTMIESEESPVVLQTVRWLHKKNADRMVEIVREKLQVVLNYLKHFYTSERGRFARTESVEGMRNIMLLVDEAAENLDRYTKLFLGISGKSIKKSKEFVELCAFYKKNILPITTHSQIATWIRALPIENILAQGAELSHVWTQELPFAPLSVELERLQKDRDYELLLLRKPDGSRFFTSKLLRNMRLASDIEEAVQTADDKEEAIEDLRKEQLSSEVFYLLANAYPAMDSFFHMGKKGRKFHLTSELFSPTVALMNACIRSVHQPEHDRKGVEGYFADFRALLNSYYHSTDFQRLLTYPPKDEKSWENSVYRLSEVMASQIINGAPLSSEMIQGVNRIIQQGFTFAVKKVGHPDGTLSRDLDIDYEAVKEFASVSNRRLTHLLQEAEQTETPEFEPLLGESLPTHLYDLSWRGSVIPVVRLPSPTHQEFVNKAMLSEVFQIALRRRIRKNQDSSCLVLNLQDRTGWREGARCEAIESLEALDPFVDHVHVLTLSREGDFYTQTGEYEKDCSAKEFKTALLQHMTEPGFGAVWPAGYEVSIKELIDSIHASVYHNRNTVTRDVRLEFIELVHILGFLIVIAQVHPDILFVTCKDGFDISLPVIACLSIFLSTINRVELTDTQKDWLRGMLLGLPLLFRERVLLAERHHRMINFILMLEQLCKSSDFGNFMKNVVRYLPKEIASAQMFPAQSRQPTYFFRRYAI